MRFCAAAAATGTVVGAAVADEMRMMVLVCYCCYLGDFELDEFSFKCHAEHKFYML